MPVGRDTERDQISTEIDRLLGESILACKQRERSALDAVSGGDTAPIILMGAGQLGRRTLAALERVGQPAVAVADNNAALWGTRIGNAPVLSPIDAAHRYGDSAAFVVSIWRAGGPHRYEHTRRQLTELGCKRVTSIAPLAWKYAEAMLPHYCLDLPHHVLEKPNEVRRAFALLSDHRSRAEFLAQLRFRILADFDGLPHPEVEPQYLATGLFRDHDAEAFVDCGAYNGDTLRSVIASGRRFDSYVALEPDRANFAALESYVRSLPENIAHRVSLLPVAAHSVRQRMRIEGSGSASAVLVPALGESPDDEVECVPLDAVIGDTLCTFLKLDIEGAEPDALAGASSTIARYRPTIAVCVYHRQDHLWQIPLLIDSMAKDYRYYLRPYNEEGWDLVCYAVPRERSLT